MKNLSLDTKQYAVVKQTLNFEEFIKKYILSPSIEIKDLKLIPINVKKGFLK